MGSDDLGIATRLRRLKNGDNRTKTVGARITSSEERELVEAADREGRSVSEWSREVLLREARRSKDDALFTEIVAVRMLLLNLMKPLAQGQKLTPENIVEIMAVVKKEKHKAAKEVMQQYAGQQQEGH